MKLRFVTTAALALAAVSPAPAVPPPADPATDEAVAHGELLYRAHCASCHGPRGWGDGPVARELKTRPADLTRLRDDDGFPEARVRQVIDGRFEIGSHGTREMPIWGLTFQQRSRSAQQEDEVAERIADLAAYLRSIQSRD